MAVLAAGASQRFGEGDKLTASFRGKPLGEYVCDNAPFELIAPGCASVISSKRGHSCQPAWEQSGFGIEINHHASEGMGTSVALAATLAAKAECDALLIALADMPLVPREHFAALIEACSDSESVICSSDGQSRMPPAVFGSGHFGALALLSGESGARVLLKDAEALTCPSEWLMDIDTPEALRALG